MNYVCVKQNLIILQTLKLIAIFLHTIDINVYYLLNSYNSFFSNSVLIYNEWNALVLHIFHTLKLLSNMLFVTVSNESPYLFF